MTSSHETRTNDTGNDSSGTEEKPSVEDIQADIEQTRAELAETVDALTAKMDVKGRTKQRLTSTKDQAAVKARDAQVQVTAKVHEAQVKATQLVGQAKEQATDEQGKPKPAVLGGAGVAAALLVAGAVLLVWRRTR
jgi:hypothetical protein